MIFPSAATLSSIKSSLLISWKQRQLAASEYPYEAAQYLALQDFVLDAGGDISFLDDPVYRISPRPQLPKPASSNELLRVKARLFRMVSLVTGGTGETPRRLISDVRLLAARNRDAAFVALAERWDGDFNIQSGDSEQAVQCFQRAEKLYESLPDSSSRDRYEALLGHAIALRLLGKPEESAKLLTRALAVDPDDPRSQIRYNANLGALYFYSDPNLRRHYWENAFDIARQANIEELAVHMDLDLASLDVIDRRISSARQRLDGLIEASSERRFENSLMRALVMMSAVDLIEGWPDSALGRLDEARRLGYVHHAGKRLWKIHANSATAHEMRGDLDRAYQEDRQMVGVLKAVAWERRIALAPANLLLRAHDNPDDNRFSALVDQLHPEALEAATSIARALGDGVPLLGQFPLEHAHIISGRLRFVIV